VFLDVSGDRSGTVKDAWDIRWTLATRVKEVTKEEIAAATAKWMQPEADTAN